MLDMERREFIGLVGGGGLLLATKVMRARAQQPAMPVIGFLRDASFPEPDANHRLTAFRQGLKEAGCVEGQNVAIEYHSDERQTDRLPLLVADLLRRQVARIRCDKYHNGVVTNITTAAMPAGWDAEW